MKRGKPTQKSIFLANAPSKDFSVSPRGDVDLGRSGFRRRRFGPPHPNYPDSPNDECRLRDLDFERLFEKWKTRLIDQNKVKAADLNIVERYEFRAGIEREAYKRAYAEKRRADRKALQCDEKSLDRSLQICSETSHREERTPVTSGDTEPLKHTMREAIQGFLQAISKRK